MAGGLDLGYFVKWGVVVNLGNGEEIVMMVGKVVEILVHWNVQGGPPAMIFAPQD